MSNNRKLAMRLLSLFNFYNHNK